MAVIARCGASRDALGLLTAIVGVDDRFRRVKASLIQVRDDQVGSVSWQFLPAASIRKLLGIPPEHGRRRSAAGLWYDLCARYQSTPEWRQTFLLLVEVRGGGLTGLGYSYASYGSAYVTKELLADIVIGRDTFGVPSSMAITTIRPSWDFRTNRVS